ncbi:hypothetical protein ANN_25524 [Periplaneta americana]|uniref:Uncharacterized protein n=1 Tax=Periplaneta americana TaxID=6978 RepID=A0ABQ8S1M4_PERAM|nr:hypothetical protein ANN_25524 [Periplaneta americana]
MAGLCESGNELMGSLKASNSGVISTLHYRDSVSYPRIRDCTMVHPWLLAADYRLSLSTAEEEGKTTSSSREVVAGDVYDYIHTLRRRSTYLNAVSHLISSSTRTLLLFTISSSASFSSQFLLSQ